MPTAPGSQGAGLGLTVWGLGGKRQIELPVHTASRLQL